MGIDYDYDDLGRVTKIYRILSGVTSVGVVEYYYDDFDTPIRKLFSIDDHYFDQTSNLKGRLAASIATDEIDGICVGQFFFYDDEGRIIRKLTAISGSPQFQQTDYEYDIHGKTTKEYFYYSGDRLRKKYTYDRLGRMEKVVQSVYKTALSAFADTELVHYSYDGLGKIKNKTFSAVTPGTYQVADTYDIRDRLTNFSSSGTKGFREIIRYGASGNIDSAKYIYKFGGGDTAYACSYTYDLVNRLIAATVNNGVTTRNNSYIYDEAGRFFNKQERSDTLTNYTFYTRSNRLQKTSKNAAAGKEYIYDKYGNLVVDYTKNMAIQYNWRNQPMLFNFYDSLGKAGLTFDATTGIYNGSIDLYTQVDNKVNAHIITPLSKVKMLYDASGNRVCKMEVRE